MRQKNLDKDVCSIIYDGERFEEPLLVVNTFLPVEESLCKLRNMHFHELLNQL